jgi:ParB-like chromosome segregation protein Spo0J
MTLPDNQSDVEYESHPAAMLFPLMTGKEFEALVEDIRAHGLREAIVLYGGKILDGRNRALACIEAGVAPIYRDFSDYNEGATTDSDAVNFVISANIHRRHLTPRQRRDLIAQVLKLAPEKSNRQIAATTKVDHKTVATMRTELESTGAPSRPEYTTHHGR